MKPTIALRSAPPASSWLHSVARSRPWPAPQPTRHGTATTKADRTGNVISILRPWRVK